jgi:type I restriction enzyme R subunit
MAFFAGKLVLVPEPENPTIVVITDRNDLDDQLFGVFASCEELLRQAPTQVQDRTQLRTSWPERPGPTWLTDWFP